VEGGEHSLGKLDTEVKELQAEADDTTKSIAALEEETDSLTRGQEDLEAQVAKLKERLNKNGV
jgi:peptidoglycan hydrolase CwlO-like protein